jgi:hypothetical protein
MPFLYFKMLKKIILFVALALPVFVFIFLYLFGENRFDIPVYWSEGVNVEGCKSQPGPYLLPDSALNAWGWKGDKATLIVLDQASIKDNLGRIADLFEGQYAVIQPGPVPACLLLAGDSSKVILVDSKKQIRGYYTPTTRKETDRLRDELGILLKQN